MPGLSKIKLALILARQSSSVSLSWSRACHCLKCVILFVPSVPFSLSLSLSQMCHCLKCVIVIVIVIVIVFCLCPKCVIVCVCVIVMPLFVSCFSRQPLFNGF